jgi:DNA-binding CsgD family transcriptional regulator
MNMPALESVGQDSADKEYSDVCIANLDSGLRVLEANDDFLHKLGSPSAEVYGQHFSEFVHASVKPVIMKQLNRLAEGRRDRFDSHFMGPMSTPARFSGGLTGVAVRGSGGHVNTIVLLVNPGTSVPTPPRASDRRKLLSEVDAKVLEGVAAGCSTVQLAGKLFLSRQGVEYHVGAMLRRFRCPNRPALVAKAYSQGVLCLGQWPPRVVGDYVR